MEPLEQLRAKIADFPGYDGDLERRRSDAYVRSYLGEALANFAGRCTLPAELQERVDDLILRVGFADPRAFATHHIGAGQQDAENVGAVVTADAAIVELADRAGSVGMESAAAFLDEVAAILDGREAALRAAALKKIP